MSNIDQQSNYNQGECPTCLAPGEDADVNLSNHYERNGLLWERVIISRRCGHQQALDYPTGLSLSADATEGGPGCKLKEIP